MADTTATIDLVSPSFVEEKKITITLESTETLLADRAITALFDYTDAGDGGVVLPLDFIVQPVSGEPGEPGGYLEKNFTRSVPERYTFTVPAAGEYLLVLSERYHNRYWGSLDIVVEGDEFTELEITRR